MSLDRAWIKKWWVLIGVALAPLASAQDYPRKPLILMVAFAPGSSTDIIARLVSPKLSEGLGQPVIVENKPGAAGNIATQYVKKTPADGYILLLHSVAFTVNPSLYGASAGYDAKDFSPVALGPRTPNVITVHPSIAAQTLPELIALARSKPLNYASSGSGTTTHLSIERLKTATGVNITHIPYQPAQAINAVVGGHTEMASTSLPPALPQIKAGRLRALAVTSATRSALLPDVPSVGEFGYKDFDDYTWFGFFVLSGTPPAIVERLNREINRALDAPEVKERLAQLGLDAKLGSPSEFAAFLNTEVPKWAEVVRTSGAKAD
jgi:tripartite-type tricarboxylate transporter receptor subunit TctC